MFRQAGRTSQEFGGVSLRETDHRQIGDEPKSDEKAEFRSEEPFGEQSGTLTTRPPEANWSTLGGPIDL